MNLKTVLDNLKFQNIITCTDKEIIEIKDIRNEKNIHIPPITDVGDS